ncbi:MAG: hypoxanthine phosphoribosyltransferase [Lachnospiraceae bacterium]|nr:hypoxanthine phosphoribosyltransferase [Lachnospiraceae bacterium]MBR4768461.1 hypoxanthine phosphoribosyltransferase [Lachnospiraceae bacterium]
MEDEISVLIPEKQIIDRIREIADDINKTYAGQPVHLIGILKGSVFFICELAKHITLPTTMDFIQVSSYGDGTKSSGVVRISKDTDETIEGKNVFVVEDIVDSGRTLSYLLNLLKARNPKTLKLCTLLDKPSRRVVEIHPDYVGFEVPDKFVVGFGLDFAQKYRNLPYIGVVEKIGGEE